MKNTYKKLNKSKVKGLNIRNGSYFLVKCINGERLNTSIGRVEAMDIEEADRRALATIERVKDLGLKAYKALGKNKYLLGHNEMILSDVFHEFIEYVSTTGTKKSKGGFRRESLNNYHTEYKLRWHINGLLQLPVGKITDDHIETWFRQIEKIKNKDGSPKVSANFYSLTLLSRLFNWAVDRRYCDINPCFRMVKSSERVEPQKKKSEAEERLSITSDEFGKFLFALVHSQPSQKKRNNDTARDLILMAIMTGSRDTELKNLRWSWFDSTTTFGSYIAPAKANDKYFEGTKGKRDYYYACSEIIQAMLKERYANRQALANELGGDAPFTYVFPNSIGTGAIDNVRKRIKNICEYAGIDKPISMHSFRFTFSNIIEQRTVDGTSFSERITKAVMHHKDSSITASYMKESSIDKVQIHECFQHVEEFCSKAVGVGTVYDIFMMPHRVTGTTGIALDNKSITDDRVTDTTALRNVLYGDGVLQHKEIIKKEEEILKDLFPNLPKEWNKKTRIFNSMAKVDVKPLSKKDMAITEGKQKPKKPEEIIKLIRRELDMMQENVHKTFEGQVAVVRYNFEFNRNIETDAKALKKFITKYPEHYKVFKGID